MSGTYEERAVALFYDGANCAQAVFAAFAPLFSMEEKTALRLAAPFGGGLGRLREVCGAVSGMCMAAGMLYGYDDLHATEEKAAHYRLVQELCGAFRERFGSIICRELLGAKRAETAPTPAPRTDTYYHERPCARQVGAAAAILAQYIESHPPKNVSKEEDHGT